MPDQSTEVQKTFTWVYAVGPGFPLPYAGQIFFNKLFVRPLKIWRFHQNMQNRPQGLFAENIPHVLLGQLLISVVWVFEVLLDRIVTQVNALFCVVKGECLRAKAQIAVLVNPYCERIEVSHKEPWRRKINFDWRLAHKTSMGRILPLSDVEFYIVY